MLFFIKILRRLIQESHLIKVYLALVIFIAVVSKFMSEDWMGFVVSGFIFHVGFLYFRNLKRFQQFEIDARPMMLEYQDYINRRADVAGVERPFEGMEQSSEKLKE